MQEPSEKNAVSGAAAVTGAIVAVGSVGPTEARNRRREPRAPRRERLFLQLALPEERNGDERSGTVRPTLFAASANLSANGLCVHCEHALEPGARVECWVRVSGCEGNFLLAATVRWARVAEDGAGHDVGLELLPEPGTDHGRWASLFQTTADPRQQSA